VDFEGRCLPRFPPPLPFFLFDVQDVDCVFDGVDGDDVAVFDECDRTSDLSFGYDVADDETVRPGWFFFWNNLEEDERKDSPATETTVCDTGHVQAETCTHDQTRRFQHLGHT